MNQMIRDFISNRRGNIAIMFVLATFPMLAGIGMAIEYANINAQRSKLQNAVDAAALFAGSYLSKQGTRPPKKIVKGFVRANYDGPFKMDKYLQVGNDLVLRVDTEIPAYFFGDIYPDAFKHKISATVPFGTRSHLEFVMVLDSTGSMAFQGKMDALKSVATDFVDRMMDFNNASNVIRIGLVPFNNHVNVGPDNRFEYWVDAPPGSWKGCVGSLPDPYTMKEGVPVVMDGGVATTIQFPGFEPPELAADESNFNEHSTNNCPSPIVELTDSKPILKNGIDSMSPLGTTYVGEGAMWGLRVLSDVDPFDSAKPLGSLPKTIRHRKILLVLTDGDNNSIPDSTVHQRNIKIDKEQSDVNTSIACQAARDAGVIIYSIAFGTEVTDKGKASMLDCAGDPDRYFEAAVAGELSSVFEKLLSEMVKFRLGS